MGIVDIVSKKRAKHAAADAADEASAEGLAREHPTTELSVATADDEIRSTALERETKASELSISKRVRHSALTTPEAISVNQHNRTMVRLSAGKPRVNMGEHDWQPIVPLTYVWMHWWANSWPLYVHLLLLAVLWYLFESGILLWLFFFAWIFFFFNCCWMLDGQETPLGNLEAFFRLLVGWTIRESHSYHVHLLTNGTVFFFFF